MKFKGNPSKMQFFLFVIITFGLSSFKFLNHFPYWGINVQSRDHVNLRA